MALEPVSSTFDDPTPTQWLVSVWTFIYPAFALRLWYQFNLDPFAFEQMIHSDETFGLALLFASIDPSLPMELQPGAHVNDGETICAICYSLILYLPPPLSLPPTQPATPLPPNWHEIPLTPYNHGRKQWDYTPSGPVLFQVKGCPGVSLGNALRKKFAGLEGRDDLVLQNAKKAISCRFLVGFSCQHVSLYVVDELTSLRQVPWIPARRVAPGTNGCRSLNSFIDFDRRSSQRTGTRGATQSHAANSRTMSRGSSSGI